MFNFYYFISKSRKCVLLLILGCAWLMQAEAQLGTNLIVNGDAELVPVLSNGWAVDGGIDMGFLPYADNGPWYLPDTSSYSNSVTDGVGHGAHGGKHFFNAGVIPFVGEFAVISQVINLPAGLLGQDLVFSFGGFVSTDGFFGGGVNGDIVEIKVDYITSLGLVVHSWDSAWVAEGPTDFGWHNLTNAQTIGAGEDITHIKITLTGTNNNSSEPIEAFFDDLSLVASVPLPITLLDFTAVQRPDHTVGLQWQTGQEENSHYIDVERGGDGKSFTPIGRVAAAGNSQQVKDYSFVDEAPLTGNNFYRLKLVDLDAAFKYSKILEIRPTASGKTIEVFSNPFHDQIGLQITATVPDRLVLSLVDATGRTCLRQSINTQSGNNFINLYPSAGIAAGVYFLHIQGSQTNQTIRVLKQ